MSRMIRLLLVPVLAAAFPAAAAPKDGAEPPGPRYAHEDYRHQLRKAPRLEGIPEGLALKVERHPFPPDTRDRDLDTAATEAGRWTAEALSRRVGSLHYYRAGFYDGLHLGLEDRGVGGSEQVDGLRYGSRDPSALRHGELLGAEGAETMARVEAARRVESQFMNLARDPVPDARSVAPAWTPVEAGIAAPAVEDVLRDIPAAHIPGLSRRFSRAFDAWRFDPWGLYSCRGYAAFLDENWAHSGHAFEYWKEGARRSAVYRKLGHPSQKQRFREVFKAAYSSRLAMLFQEEMFSSFEMGYLDGWRYGFIVISEWRFRAGYTEGFNQAALTAARAAYSALYPDVYRRHYDDEFRTWSAMSVPGIVSFQVEDESDDGIFEPGEPIRAWIEMANYGGTPGTYTAVLSSALLAAPVEAEFDLPARQVVTTIEPIVAALCSSATRGRRGEVRIQLADHSQEFSLVVSYPLQFTGKVWLREVDIPAERATVEVQMANRSRKPVSGTVLLAGVSGGAGRPVAGTATAERADFDSIMPGEIRTGLFELGEVDPLAALSGEIELRFQALAGATVYDEMAYEFPVLALDLRSDEMNRFLVALAMDETISGRILQDAVDLALRRLAVDWEVAVLGSGNPYKHDYEEGDVTTALGELVDAFRKEHSRMANLEVFTRLAEEIESMADELPGVHPLLRKYVRKLAGTLG
jgi:hypothetical protein